MDCILDIIFCTCNCTCPCERRACDRAILYVAWSFLFICILCLPIGIGLGIKANWSIDGAYQWPLIVGAITWFMALCGLAGNQWVDYRLRRLDARRESLVVDWLDQV